jgi:hypothetical protein
MKSSHLLIDFIVLSLTPINSACYISVDNSEHLQLSTKKSSIKQGIEVLLFELTKMKMKETIFNINSNVAKTMLFIWEKLFLSAMFGMNKNNLVLRY